MLHYCVIVYPTLSMFYNNVSFCTPPNTYKHALHYTYQTLTNTRCTKQDTIHRHTFAAYFCISRTYIYTYIHLTPHILFIVCYTCYHLLQMRYIIKKGLLARCCIFHIDGEPSNGGQSLHCISTSKLRVAVLNY